MFIKKLIISLHQQKQKAMFNQLKQKVQDNFNKMSQGDLFYAAVDREKVWDIYLLNFPEEERQPHNCNCCKSFIRQWSGIVALVDGQRVTIWDNIELGEYTTSIKALSAYIHSLPITDVFFNEFAKCGTDKNFDSIKGVTWEHFNIVLPAKFVKKSNIDSTRADLRTNFELLHRADQTITNDSIATVLDLIAQGSLYKGEEYKHMLLKFQEYQRDSHTFGIDNVWLKSTQLPVNVCRIRNSSIGQLLVNLSEGMDLDTAVGKYEQMVAPTNYKRPTALVTPRMVEQAKEKLNEMGLIGSLERRYANEADLNTEDIIYVDKSSATQDVFGEIAKSATHNPRSFSKIEEVTIADFIKKVLPGSKSVEVLLENKHLNNMVSLLTAQELKSKSLFKWDNLFSWSYTGGITDSIKERVKAAGGNVEGVLRASLSWHNFDDLDLHVTEPDGNRIYYADRGSNTSGSLDVDMNASGGHTRDAVENIVWTNKAKMLSGTYKVVVHNFTKREAIDSGFTVQMEYNGEVFEFSQDTSPLDGQKYAFIFNYDPQTGITFPNGAPESKLSTKEKWGIKTNTFHKVKNIMLSPNHWSTNVGNKHFLFFLENCINDEQPRPFFNEFLKDEFTENRKVFEVLGSKVKVEPTDYQLSGLGFSETNRNEIIVKVTGSFTRTLKIKF